MFERFHTTLKYARCEPRGMSDEGGPFGASCPRCEEPIDGDNDACAACGLAFRDEEGGLSDDAVQAMLDNVDVPKPQQRGPVSVSAPATMRLVVGLAITIPVAPIVLFIASAIAPLPVFVSTLLFTLAWAVPGYVLARRRALPTYIVADGLLLTGLVLASAPMVIVAGRALLGTAPGDIGALGTNVYAAQSVFLLIGLVVLGVGALIRRHAVAEQARWERGVDPPEQ